MPERPTPCTKCPDKPCINNPFNEDQECLYHPGQEALAPGMLVIAQTVEEEDEAQQLTEDV
jgi:hypothetical protein